MYTERQAIGLLFKILWAAFFLKLSPNVYSKHKKPQKLCTISTQWILKKICVDSFPPSHLCFSSRQMLKSLLAYSPGCHRTKLECNETNRLLFFFLLTNYNPAVIGSWWLPSACIQADTCWACFCLVGWTQWPQWTFPNAWFNNGRQPRNRYINKATQSHFSEWW